MIINIAKDSLELGKRAGKAIAEAIRAALEEKGEARILLSTGASQFETLSTLVKEDLDWSHVTMFHLDEYVDLPVTHKASFRKYLNERFVSVVNPGEVFYVNGEGDVGKNIAILSEAFKKAPIDVGVIGIGENGHIAFNDPPADFNTDEIYKVVKLDERCRRQQVGEGWFESVSDVPEKAISMTVKAILSSRKIISSVPHSVKAEAIKNTVTGKISPYVPATILKTHPDWNLFLDSDSAAMLLSINGDEK